MRKFKIAAAYCNIRSLGGWGWEGGGEPPFSPLSLCAPLLYDEQINPAKFRSCKTCQSSRLSEVYRLVRVCVYVWERARNDTLASERRRGWGGWESREPASCGEEVKKDGTAWVLCTGEESGLHGRVAPLSLSLSSSLAHFPSPSSPVSPNVYIFLYISLYPCYNAMFLSEPENSDSSDIHWLWKVLPKCISKIIRMCLLWFVATI